MKQINWIKYNDEEHFGEQFREGTICRTEDGEFVIVGKINRSKGLSDEFNETITHYTEDFIIDMRVFIELAKQDFNNSIIK